MKKIHKYASVLVLLAVAAAVFFTSLPKGEIPQAHADPVSCVPSIYVAPYPGTHTYPSASITCVNGLNHNPTGLWPSDSAEAIPFCDGDDLTINWGQCAGGNGQVIGIVSVEQPDPQGSDSQSIILPSGCEAGHWTLHYTCNPLNCSASGHNGYCPCEE